MCFDFLYDFCLKHCTEEISAILSYMCIGIIATYASETWVLKETAIQKLLVFEWKILRRIFGPTKENQIWRIKPNEELEKLIKHNNIVN